MSKAKNLGSGASFAQARPISARRAAIGAATGAPTDGVPAPTSLPLRLISQNPDNPRDELRDLEGLAESIREIGLVNAITVATVEEYLAHRPQRASEIDEGARYLVVDGHRRLEAARLAGSEEIRVSVNDGLVSTDEALLEAAFVANVHRDDMNPLEQAQALRRLVEFYGSQSKASKRLGIGQSTISSKLSILDLDPGLQADLIAGRRTVEDVRNLARLDPEQQRAKADARAEERRRRAEQLSRRDSGAGEEDHLSRRDRSGGEGEDLSRRDGPGDGGAEPSRREAVGEDGEDLSRRDRSARDHGGLSRRDSPGDEGRELSRRDGATRDDGGLSRRDSSGDEGEGLSRREGSGVVRMAPVPDQRPAPVGEGETLGVNGDGAALMDYARQQLDPAQRSAMLQRYFQVASGVEEVAEDLSRGLAPQDLRELAVIVRKISELLARP
ncbi:ParB/RepB/Spo0J family partition protein [Streptomyces solincola]|uniref:ParB/RepB/Spo0J family partition protein n=1 Tax=Streptomyces solincola TaxID=2100817 RepID=UPI001C613EDD|nr:ParB/RepB/Spo0J family partition protein [Streptomyces solincola]